MSQRRVIVILLLLAQVPWLLQFLWQLWQRPHYELAPLVLLSTGVVAYWRRAEFAGVKEAAQWPAVSGWILWSCLLLLAAWLQSPWLAYVAFLIGLCSLLWDYGGGPLLRCAAPYLLLLVLLLPPPFGLEQRALLKLQSWTTDLCSQLLDWFDVVHYQAGHLIETPQQKLFVEEACSGVHSIISIVALSLLWCLLQRRYLTHCLLLAVVAGAVVFFVNLLRVAVGILLWVHWSIDTLQGENHGWAGMIAFGSALLLCLSADQLLMLFESQPISRHYLNYLGDRGTAIPAEEPARDSVSFRELAALIPSRPWFIALVAPAAVGSVTSLAAMAILQREIHVAGMARLPKLELPESLAGWSQRGYQAQTRNVGSHYGEYSQEWLYERGGVRATVSLAHPFTDWHDVTVCYRGQGWVKERELRQRLEVPGNSLSVPFLRVVLQKHDAAGSLRYAMLDTASHWLEPDSDSFIDRLTGRLLRGGLQQEGGTTLQVQVFVESALPLAPTEEEAVQELFLVAASQLQRQLAALP